MLSLSQLPSRSFHESVKSLEDHPWSKAARPPCRSAALFQAFHLSEILHKRLFSKNVFVASLRFLNSGYFKALGFKKAFSLIRAEVLRRIKIVVKHECQFSG